MDEQIGSRQQKTLPLHKAQSFRKEYMDKVELMLVQKFENSEGVTQAVEEGRLQRQIPDYLADWWERIVFDGQVVAELKYSSYFVLS